MSTMALGALCALCALWAPGVSGAVAGLAPAKLCAAAAGWRPSKRLTRIENKVTPPAFAALLITIAESCARVGG